MERKFLRVKLEFERVSACVVDCEHHLVSASRRVVYLEAEVDAYQVEADEVEAERQGFLESHDEKNYFAGGGTLRCEHDCYLANMDVISLCKKVGVDPGVIDGMKRDQLRYFHMFLKSGGFDHNTAIRYLQSRKMATPD